MIKKSLVYDLLMVIVFFSRSNNLDHNNYMKDIAIRRKLKERQNIKFFWFFVYERNTSSGLYVTNIFFLRYLGEEAIKQSQGV